MCLRVVTRRQRQRPGIATEDTKENTSVWVCLAMIFLKPCMHVHTKTSSSTPCFHLCCALDTMLCTRVRHRDTMQTMALVDCCSMASDGPGTRGLDRYFWPHMATRGVGAAGLGGMPVVACILLGCDPVHCARSAVVFSVSESTLDEVITSRANCA